MTETFTQRAQDMGLDTTLVYKGLLKYSDRHSEVIYRQLTPLSHPEDPDEHPTDGIVVPVIGIFTKALDETDYRYVGYVSDLYKFIGNEVLNQRIRDSILATGMPIVTENTILTNNHTRMRNEIIIQNGQQVPNVGDILPVMIVNNSYDGTRAASVAFGIATQYNQQRIIFAFRLGEMRQVHVVSSTTNISSAINEYIGVFSENIADMISNSFSSQLSENDMLGVLDVIEESFGKKRREAVSAMLDEIQGQTENTLPTAWQMFLAIVRYSSFEPNLNIRRLMENAAESVLVIPPRMLEVLERLQSS